MSSPIEPLFYSVTDAAKLLGIGRTKMLALIRTGRVKARTLDGRLKIPTEAIGAFIEAEMPESTAGKPVHACQ